MTFMDGYAFGWGFICAVATALAVGALGALFSMLVAGLFRS
jgi:Na+/alanine symporter